MWFKKKTELEKLIINYSKDQETLLEFARCVAKPRIEEVTLEDIKAYYTACVAPHNGLFRRMETMKHVRKFFRYYRSKKCLRASQIRDNPLNSVENIAIIKPMEKVSEKKRGPGRPRDIASIKKVVALRNEGITFRQIALVLKKDKSQIFVWWRDREMLLS